MVYYVARLSFFKPQQKGAIIRYAQPLFFIGDFKDFPGFISKLIDAQDPQLKYLRKHFRPETTHLLESYLGSKEQERNLQKKLIDELNMIVKGPSLLNDKYFMGILVESYFLDSLDKRDTQLINRLLLEKLYPSDILMLDNYKTYPMIFAEKLIMENPDYRAPRSEKRIKRGYSDLYVRGFLNGRDGRLLAFKVGRRKDVNINLLPNREEDFGKAEVENYPNIMIIWFREQQIIFVERNPQVFSNFEVFIRSLEDHLTRLLREYDLSVSIEPLSDYAKFWDYIQKFSDIYEIEFNLITPNFFGAGMHARELLNSAKNSYGAKEVKMGISNDDGHLRVDQDDESTSQLVRWVGEGGGEWKIQGKKGDKKITVRSTDGAKMVSLELVGYDADSALQFLKQVLPELTTKS